MHPGPGRRAPGRAAPGQQLPAAGGGSRPGPAADPCSAGRTLHRTCRAQILRVAADEKQTAFIFKSLKGHYSYVTAVFIIMTIKLEASIKTESHKNVSLSF